jgi:hypothetical protein
MTSGAYGMDPRGGSIMAHRSHRWSTGCGALVALFACTTWVACARRAVEPVAPPAPRALTITAQRKQSQAQQDRDKADCQRMAAGQATSSASWAQIFTACMGGRGYMVE